MKKVFNKFVIMGLCSLGVFIILLILLLTVDKKVNIEGEIGLYSFNKLFLVEEYEESWDGFSDAILFISLGFLGGLVIYGLYQLVKRKNPFKVDKDILLVGGGVLILIILWILFDKVFVVNYRPTLIDIDAEPSFPSTHVMVTTFILLASGYCLTKRYSTKSLYTILTYAGLSALIALGAFGRILSSMHWMTDVLGGFFIGFGLFSLVVGLDKVFTSKKENGDLDKNYGNENC
ncbi:MAG: phosphatase PAP2 family protein [Anaeroplasmataceae bacterium]|nr:phosphatase PAP2 family protein [Anaeroplasmataceae bacterium]